MTIFTVNVRLNQTTIDALTNQRFFLYGCKAVQGPPGGAPRLWFRSRCFKPETRLEWETRYQAYTSTGAIVDGKPIETAASFDIAPGQTLTVTSPSGTGTVGSTTGLPAAICILNGTGTGLTSGLAEPPLGEEDFAPVFAFSLLPGVLEAIVPVEKVFLSFSTQSIRAGTVVLQAFADGLLVDLTGAGPINQRTVDFDIDRGWQGDERFATAVKAGKELAPLLVRSR